MIIKSILADITTLPVDVIVNAANSSLMVGGGVDAAIHQAAGPELLEECRTLNGCAVGDAKLTAGYQLKSKHIIHAVGPRWEGGRQGEHGSLSSCYRRAISLAERIDARSIAFPCISTGVFHFPNDQAADIAVYSVLGSISELSSLQEVVFCCFTDTDLELYKAALNEQLGVTEVKKILSET